MVTPAPAPGGWPDPFAEAAVWPELWRSRATLVFPSRPDHPTASGWLPADAAPALEHAPRWHASLDGHHLTVTAPDGHLWYRGPLFSTRPWRRTARSCRQLLLITGPFTHPADFLPAANGGHLLCALADASLSCGF